MERVRVAGGARCGERWVLRGLKDVRDVYFLD